MACYSSWHQIFETDRRNVKRRTKCFLKRFCTSARKKDRTLSVYKSSSMKSFWEPPLIVSFQWTDEETPCSTALSSDGQRATIPHNYQGRPSFTSVYFWPTRTRESTPANANNSVLAKNPWRSWIFWAQPKSARIFTSEILKIFCVPDSETGQQSAPRIQFELMPIQPQQA